RGRPHPGLSGDQCRGHRQGPADDRRRLWRAAVPVRLQGRREIGHLQHREGRGHRAALPAQDLCAL
ncbi:hypothetical protein LTR94_038652, partial [Friedmanniomyces endolithicus]